MEKLQVKKNFSCRPGCGACCIAISISSALPGMPGGKKAGQRCVNLSISNLCVFHDTPDYPPVCRNLRPAPDICGSDFDEAMELLKNLEQSTIS